MEEDPAAVQPAKKAEEAAAPPLVEDDKMEEDPAPPVVPPAEDPEEAAAPPPEDPEEAAAPPPEDPEEAAAPPPEDPEEAAAPPAGPPPGGDSLPPLPAYLPTAHTLSPGELTEAHDEAVRAQIKALQSLGVEKVNEVISLTDPGRMLKEEYSEEMGWTTIKPRYGNDGGGKRVCAFMTMAQILGFVPKASDDKCIRIISHTLALMALILKLDEPEDELTIIKLQTEDGAENSDLGRIAAADTIVDGNDLDAYHFLWFQRCFSGVRNALSQAGEIKRGRGVAPKEIEVHIIKNITQKRKQKSAFIRLRTPKPDVTKTPVTVRHVSQSKGHWAFGGFYSPANAHGLKSKEIGELADAELAKLFPRSPLYMEVREGDKEGHHLTPTGPGTRRPSKRRRIDNSSA